MHLESFVVCIVGKMAKRWCVDVHCLAEPNNIIFIGKIMWVTLVTSVHCLAEPNNITFIGKIMWVNLVTSVHMEITREIP